MSSFLSSRILVSFRANGRMNNNVVQLFVLCFEINNIYLFIVIIKSNLFINQSLLLLFHLLFHNLIESKFTAKYPSTNSFGVFPLLFSKTLQEDVPSFRLEDQGQQVGGVRRNDARGIPRGYF